MVIHPQDADMYILRTSGPSPFGRKIIMAAAVAGLSGQLVIEAADTNDASDSLRSQNPLGKIPVLVLPDGQCLFDSRVIVEFLDSEAGGGKLIPPGISRWAVLRQQALADGLMDATLLMVYEQRFRPAEQRSESWLEYQQGKQQRALDYAEAHYSRFSAEQTLHIGTIAQAAALGYLDLRFQGSWRAQYPALVAWLDQFRERLPAFDASEFKA